MRMSDQPRKLASPPPARGEPPVTLAELAAKLDTAEQRRLRRERLLSMTSGQKRQLLRAFLAWALSAFGARLTSADELTWRRFWGESGCLKFLLGLALVTTGIICMGGRDKATWDFILGVLFASGLLLGGVGLLWTFARHLRQRLAGHTATATVVGHDVVNDAGIDRFTSLIDFTTRTGEVRRRVPFDRRTLPPIIDRINTRFEADSIDWTEEPEPLAIGTRFTIVYDPAQPDWIERASLWGDGWRLIGALAMLTLGVVITMQIVHYLLTGSWALTSSP